MRKLDTITLLNAVEVRDEFGGVSYTTNPVVIPATVSVLDNELKTAPNGYGYYRKLMILVDNNLLHHNDKVSYQGINYHVAKRSNYHSTFGEVWFAYEV